ncbi:hypothetical protein D3C77_754770 [compost metagenome]
MQYNSPYKSVNRRLVRAKGDQAGWRNLRPVGAGKSVSLPIGAGERRQDVSDSWTAFVGQSEEGLAVGARD